MRKEKKNRARHRCLSLHFHIVRSRYREMATVSFLGSDAKNKKDKTQHFCLLSLSFPPVLSLWGYNNLLLFPTVYKGSFWLPQASSSEWSSRPGSLSCPISPSPLGACGGRAPLAAAQAAVCLSAAHLLTGQRLLSVQGKDGLLTSVHN